MKLLAIAMAADPQVANALQTLAQQVNSIAERMQNLEGMKFINIQQLDERSHELQRLSKEALRSVTDAVSELQMRGVDAYGGGGKQSHIVLINDKNDPPQHFGEHKSDHLHFRSWAKKITNYLQSRRRGYRQILDWAKDFGLKPIEIEDVEITEWADRETGNAVLYDFWLKVLHGEALDIVETAPDNGLEGFRLLHQKYDPTGAQHDLERYYQLTHNVKPAKSLPELPRIIVRWEAELKEFQRKARDFPIPEKIKIAVMLNLLPVDYAKGMRKDYHKNPQGYDALRENILEYTRLETGICPPMNIDSLGHEAPLP